ncbi:cell separation during budding [Paramarasmius palmivorus]|uniref:Cell separation during budding n=1 Tax=Paramarasmius palmivorus TaxID=297713 RepID=A0AAW0D8H2_9AGAR
MELLQDVIDSRIVSVKADMSVEEACDRLLSEDINCLAVLGNQESKELTGLFDFSDVNAFLTLAATKHTFTPEDLRDKPRVQEIFLAAKAGHVPVYLVSNLSEKNPLQILPYDATVVSLLESFARGVHRGKSPPPSLDLVGIVSDRGLLSWFASYASETPSLQSFLSGSLRSFSFPSLNLYTAVIAATSKASVLEAMRLMSDEGVSSIAVLDDETGALLSAVSVTDIGKAPEGSTDGAEKFPVYSVSPSSTLFYTIQKLLATNAHRVFITTETPESSPILAARNAGNLSGIVSIVDILSLFARLAHVQDVDPTRMQRHRRASSVSSQGSRPDRSDFTRSRSSSRTSIGRTSSMSRKHASPSGARNSLSLSGSVEAVLGSDTKKSG